MTRLPDKMSFNGRHYEKFASFSNKADAEMVAKTRRHQGWFIRVIKYDFGYALYRSSRTKHYLEKMR